MLENIKPDSIMNTISNVSHGYRRVTSPLPAVPPSPKFFTLSHPPPKPPLNRSKKPDENSNIPKSASEIDLENSTDPLLGYEQPITDDFLVNCSRKAATLKPSCRETLHEYEEFLRNDLDTEIYKDIPIPATNNTTLLTENNVSFCAKGDAPSVNVTTSTPVKERPTALYKSLDRRKNASALNFDSSLNESTCSTDSQKFKTCNNSHLLVAIITISLIISLLSIIAVALIFTGVLQPMTSPVQSMQREIDALRQQVNRNKHHVNELINETSDILAKQNHKIDEVTNSVNNLSQRSSDEVINEMMKQEIRNIALDSVQQNLTSPNTNDVLGNGLSQCKYETFAIGSSPLQKSTNSGLYYANKGYVITGASCSSSPGYFATLKSTEVDVDDLGQRETYTCICTKRPGEGDIEVSRVECRIHYWQCPSST